MDPIWDESIEHLLSTIADEASLRSKLHTKCYELYRRRNYIFSLPIIVLSSIAGSSNFVSGSLTNKLVERYLILGTGILSVTVAILSAIKEKLKLGQYEESHRSAIQSWNKLRNKITFCMQLREEHRDDLGTFMQDVKTEYDRLFENSPTVGHKFVRALQRKIEREADDQLAVPHYLNGMTHFQPFAED